MSWKNNNKQWHQVADLRAYFRVARFRKIKGLNLEQMRRGLVGLARPWGPGGLVAVHGDFVVLRGGDGGHGGVERGRGRGRVGAHLLPLRGPFPLWSLQAEGLFYSSY